MKSKQRFYFMWLSLICIMVFIIQLTVPKFTEYFMLTENALTMPWQFLTAVFLHGSLSHLAYNLFALIIFGMILEQLIGSKRFALLFLVSGILANLISFYWFPNALGASGAIMAIIGTLAVLKPLMNVWAFGMIIPMFIAAVLWAIGSFLGIFGFGEQGVGHLAHLSGLLIGFVYGIILRLRYPSRKKEFNSQKIVFHEDALRKWEDSNLR